MKKSNKQLLKQLRKKRKPVLGRAHAGKREVEEPDLREFLTALASIEPVKFSRRKGT